MIERVQLIEPLLQGCEWSIFIQKWTQNGLLNSSTCFAFDLYSLQEL